MPIYVYEAGEPTDCEFCENGFEYLQKLNEDALSYCPECNAPVSRVLTAANIPGTSPSLDNENISKLGFTRYQKLEKGVYEKTAGKGPAIISNKKT